MCDRDGEWYPLDRLEVAGNTLYYARPLDFDILKYHERWLIPGQGWSISRFQFTPLEPDPVDWYIETELMSVDGPLWTVRDGFLDMMLWEGQRSRLDDADELGEAVEDGFLSPQEAAAILRSLDRLCDELHENGNSGAALLAKYATDLPR